MREKLLDLMKSEGLKPSQLAEILGINPAGISHILAGRNKPGFDLLQKILRRFPRINPDWLLLDSDRMYRDTVDESSQPEAPASASRSVIGGDLFDTVESRSSDSTPRQMTEASPGSRQTLPQPPTSRTDAPIERIIIFYADQSFESYTPTKR